MTKTKEIEMNEIVNFCENYNGTGYGEAKIIELTNDFIIKFYNGGFSENEEMDSEFKEKYKNNLILNQHPISIYKFTKLPLLYGFHIINYGNIKDWCVCYEKKDKFEYKIEIE